MGVNNIKVNNETAMTVDEISTNQSINPISSAAIYRHDAQFDNLVCYSYRDNFKQTMIDTLYRENYTVHVKFKNRFDIARKLDASSTTHANNYWFSCIDPHLEDDGWVIPNTYCICINPSTDELYLTNLNNNAVRDVVLCYNLLGTLFSPITNINTDLMNKQGILQRTDTDEISSNQIVPDSTGTDDIFRNLNMVTIGSGGQDVINSVTKTGSYSAIITFKSILVVTYPSQNGWYKTLTTPEEGFTIPNINFLYYDFDTDQFGISSSIAQLFKKKRMLLFYNLWGVLMSPIATLQVELNNIYHPQQGGGSSDNIVYQDITLSADPNTTCLIRSTIMNISDASYTKRYRIYLNPGTYKEIDIIPKDYVDIIGYNPDNTILLTDGSDTYPAPANYSYHGNEQKDYSGIPLNEIPEHAKHTFWAYTLSKVSNVTIRAEHCKYCVHQDSTMTTVNANPIFQNCTFISNNYAGVIGIGSHSNQKLEYVDCTFVDIAVGNTNSTNLHNWGGQINTQVIFNHCNFVNCSNISITEIGNKRIDVYNFIDCNSDNDTVILVGGLDSYYKDDQGNPVDIDSVPYGTNVNAGGSNIELLRTEARKVFNYTTTAKNIVYKKTASTINFGYAVYVTSNGTVSVLTTPDENFLTAMSMNDADGNIIVNNGNNHYVKAVADNYSAGDTVTITNSGMFAKSSSNVVATVRYAAELLTDGYIQIMRIK